MMDIHRTSHNHKHNHEYQNQKLKLKLIDEMCHNLSFLTRLEMDQNNRRNSNKRKRRTTDNDSAASSTQQSNTNNNTTFDRIISLSKIIMKYINVDCECESQYSLLSIEKIDTIIIDCLLPIYRTSIDISNNSSIIPSSSTNSITTATTTTTTTAVDDFYSWWRNHILKWITTTTTTSTTDYREEKYQELGWRHLKLMIKEVRLNTERPRPGLGHEHELAAWIIENEIVLIGLLSSNNNNKIKSNNRNNRSNNNYNGNNSMVKKNQRIMILRIDRAIEFTVDFLINCYIMYNSNKNYKEEEYEKEEEDNHDNDNDISLSYHIGMEFLIQFCISASYGL